MFAALFRFQSFSRLILSATNLILIILIPISHAHTHRHTRLSDSNSTCDRLLRLILASASAVHSDGFTFIPALTSHYFLMLKSRLSPDDIGTVLLWRSGEFLTRGTFSFMSVIRISSYTTTCFRHHHHRRHPYII